MKREIFFFFLVFTSALLFVILNFYFNIISDVWGAITLGCMVGGVIAIFSDKLYDLFFDN